MAGRYDSNLQRETMMVADQGALIWRVAADLLQKRSTTENECRKKNWCMGLTGAPHPKFTFIKFLPGMSTASGSFFC